uniref:C2H2-type domain-containing protein n=1 Tax=Timema tahoe TaxID=61484 RepID=A0A7R9FJS8_9NEOP|nr:unnamed protein product [Timema tahoe]
MPYYSRGFFQPTKHRTNEFDLLPSSGPGSFPCPRCGKCYRWKRNMVTHYSMGCDQKRLFQCQFCPHSSKQKSHLRVHVKAVHKDMNFLWC